MKRKFTILLSLIMMGAAVLATPTITGKASEASVSPSVLNDAKPGDADALIKANNLDFETNITLESGKTYDLGGRHLFIYNDLTLDLNGATLTSSSGTIFQCESQDAIGGYDAYKNITIKNGTIKRTGTAKGGLAILAHCSNVKLEDLTFTGVWDGHMLELGACKDVTINKCIFTAGNYSEKKDKGEYEALSLDVASQGNFDIRPLDNTSCENITITNCTFSNVRRGFGGHRIVKDHLFNKVTVKGCTFSNIDGTALEAVGFTNAVIDNNTFSQVAFGIDCKPSSDNIVSNPGEYDAHNVISNNKIALNGAASKTACGVRISGNDKSLIGDYKVSTIEVTGPHAYAVYAGNVKNSTIDNVTSSGAKINGIRVENCDGVTVSGSTISNTVSHGIALISTKNDTVSGNTINNSKKHGIALEAATNETIKGNTISKPKKSGINLWKKSTAALVSENKITKPKTCGINCQDKKSKVFATCGNVIKKAGVRPYGGDGVFFAANNSVLTLKKGKGAKIDAYGTKGKTKYSTEDKSIATVDSKGNIKAKGSGTTTVTAKRGKFKAQVKVTVK